VLFGTFISWLWIWFATAMLLTLIAPLLFSKKHRLAYAAMLCTLLALVATTLWIADLHVHHGLVIRYMTENGRLHRDDQIVIASSSGGFSAAYREFLDREPKNDNRNPTGQPYLTWSRGHGGPRYPTWRDPIFDVWGFCVTVYSQPEVPDFDFRTAHLWAVTVPAWSPIPFLLIVPALFARQYANRRRLATGHCAHCGFDLRAHAPGDKCPECSTLIPDSHKPTVSPDTGAPK
jgi:hypothetical protein